MDERRSVRIPVCGHRARSTAVRESMRKLDWQCVCVCAQKDLGQSKVTAFLLLATNVTHPVFT